MADPRDFADDLDFQPRTPRGPLIVVGGLLLLGVAAALVLLPKSVSIEDCGDLSARAEVKDPPALHHDMFCDLEGMVETDQVVAIGREDPRGETPAERLRDVRYFVRLDGAPVVAALSAAAVDVQKWRARRGSLLGFPIKGKGRLFEPRKEKGYGPIGVVVQERLGLAGQSVFIFDTQAAPPR